MKASSSEATLNEYGRFDALKETIDKDKARAYFEQKEVGNLPLFKVNIKAAQILRDFIIQGGIELEGDEPVAGAKS